MCGNERRQAARSRAGNFSSESRPMYSRGAISMLAEVQEELPSLEAVELR
jgi:hypothetical protein